jgi:hypothetical protein
VPPLQAGCLRGWEGIRPGHLQRAVRRWEKSLTNYVTPTDHTPNYPNHRARSDRLVGLAGDQRGGVRVRHGLVLLLIREGVVQDLEDAVGGRKLQANDS